MLFAAACRKRVRSSPCWAQSRLALRSLVEQSVIVWVTQPFAGTVPVSVEVTRSSAAEVAGMSSVAQAPSGARNATSAQKRNRRDMTVLLSAGVWEGAGVVMKKIAIGC